MNKNREIKEFIYSENYDDVYFPHSKPIESTLYSFHNPCLISQKFNSGKSLVISELGFGTGLNLVLAKNMMNVNKFGRLNFISCEKFPLKKEQIIENYNNLGLRSDFTDELGEKISDLQVGWNKISFTTSPQVSLAVFYGEVIKALDTWPVLESSLLCDAWFLDGFAPSKNPDMWSDEVLEKVSKNSSPGTMLSSWTAVGQVRRKLAEVGFDVKKIKGYPPKRNSLVAVKL